MQTKELLQRATKLRIIQNLCVLLTHYPLNEQIKEYFDLSFNLILDYQNKVKELEDIIEKLELQIMGL